MFEKYIEDTQGNFATMAAFAVGLLMMGVGVAVDMSGAVSAKKDLQAMLDMGLLAAATDVPVTRNRGQENQIDYRGKTHSSMLSNGYGVSDPLPIVQVEGNYLTGTATYKYQTAFGGLIGRNYMDIRVGSQVSLKGTQNLQIALVLDNTDSMNPNGKMTALKQGAVALVDAIEASGSASNIALVPFAKYVRVDMDFAGVPWLDLPNEYEVERTWQQATHSGGVCTVEDRIYYVDGVEEIRPTNVCTGQTTTYETQSRMVEGVWDGCVGVRDTPNDAVDGNYSFGVPGLLHKDRFEVTGLNIDIPAYCPAEIVPLTADYDDLRDNIGNLFGTGTTYLPMGLMWGQRVLSPIVPYHEAASTDISKNVMVIMSDGKNTAEVRDTAQTRATHEAPPYIYEAKSVTEVVPLADALTASLCTEIKESGTEIYTIAFQIGDLPTQTILENCASSSAHAYTAENNGALVIAFENIADNLESVVRISR